jgi:hypothetical protein
VINFYISADRAKKMRPKERKALDNFINWLIANAEVEKPQPQQPVKKEA